MTYLVVICLLLLQIICVPVKLDLIKGKSQFHTVLLNVKKVLLLLNIWLCIAVSKIEIYFLHFLTKVYEQIFLKRLANIPAYLIKLLKTIQLEVIVFLGRKTSIFYFLLYYDLSVCCCHQIKINTYIHFSCKYCHQRSQVCWSYGKRGGYYMNSVWTYNYFTEIQSMLILLWQNRRWVINTVNH